MKRSQLNISIDPELLKRIKECARKSGKSITGYVVDCCTKQIEDYPFQSLEPRIERIEERLQSIEKNLSSPLTGSKKTTLLTPREADNCNEFIKAIFEKEVERKEYKSIKNAWNDLIRHISCFDQWSDIYTFRLKESLFIDHADPLSSEEINLLTKGQECPCPIRTGLINWIKSGAQGKCCCSDKSFPSQEVICEKGSILLKDMYA